MKSMKIKLKHVAAVVLIVGATGCASTKQAEFESASDLNSYKVIQVADTKITSDEANSGAVEANNRIKSFYSESVSKSLTSVNKAVVSSQSASSGALVLESRVDIHYGSRALRYWVGFGAGKGHATITLTGKDSVTGEEKYKDVRTLSLSMGKFGGSFEEMIKQKISEQVKKFETTVKA